MLLTTSSCSMRSVFLLCASRRLVSVIMPARRTMALCLMSVMSLASQVRGDRFDVHAQHDGVAGRVRDRDRHRPAAVEAGRRRMAALAPEAEERPDADRRAGRDLLLLAVAVGGRRR